MRRISSPGDKSVLTQDSSDAGSQYTALRFTEHHALEGIAPSIGSVGDAYDNALMKSMIGLFKAVCIRITVFTPSHTRRSATWSTPLPVGSTGETTDACTAPSE
jgi:transposase InsO family protein